MALSIFKTAKTWKLIQQMNQLSVCVCVLDTKKKNGNKPCQMILVVSFFRQVFWCCTLFWFVVNTMRARPMALNIFFGWTVKSILINYYVTCTKHRSSTRGKHEEEEEKCTRFYIGTEWMNEKRIINSFLHVFLYCKWREVRAHTHTHARARRGRE